jgi:arsenite/tail-anchored protein-transporting ATPase
MPRIILFTGKGGVGKTTVAAATAVCAADRGQRTIVVSTDAAHSLGDSFDIPLGPEPTQIAPNLWGQEIDLLYQMEKYWGTVSEYLSSLLAWKGMDNLVAEETSVLPGMEELASLLQIVALHDAGQFDTILIDCAPTGETLRLLSFPEMARWYLEKIFPLQRGAMKIARPILRTVMDVPMPDDKLFDVIQGLIQDLVRMHGLLSDPKTASVRLVLNPEKMVIKEAQRTFTYLSLYGYPVDAVISNRVIPGYVTDAHFAKWKEIQARYNLMIEEGFAPIPILHIPMMDSEVVGLDSLRTVGAALYEGRDPSAVLHTGQRHTVKKEEGRYLLTLELPFADKEAVKLTRAGDELIVHIANQKRNLVLPRALLPLEVESAKLENGELRVTFAGGSAAAK